MWWRWWDGRKGELALQSGRRWLGSYSLFNALDFLDKLIEFAALCQNISSYHMLYIG